MKTLFALCLISTTSFAAQTVECHGSFYGSPVKISATVMSNTEIDYLTDTYNEATNLRNLKATPGYSPKKHVGYNQFKYNIPGTLTAQKCEFLLPNTIATLTGTFVAYDICHEDQGGGTIKLTCTAR